MFQTHQTNRQNVLGRRRPHARHGADRFADQEERPIKKGDDGPGAHVHGVAGRGAAEGQQGAAAGADEGTPARQFASDELSPLESMIEVQDELEGQDNSIRKELEIEDGSSIYNEVIALVKEEISNIKGVIKQSDILSIKNKLVKTFGKALQKTLKNKIGGDKEHRAFVKKYSLVIYNKFTTKQLTALARELGNDNYFTYRPLGDKKLSYS